MKTKLLFITVLIATISCVTSCAQKDLIDCAYQADDDACERLGETQNTLNSELYQEPDSVKVKSDKLPTLN